MPDFARGVPALGDPASVAAMRRAMDAGETTSVALTSHYRSRIDELNPVLHAVITIDPEAHAQAAASDERRARGAARGPLDGIPVLVKDNVQVAGMPTTAGSPALLDAQPPDAFIVARLRAAGAVILGKANLSEWANFRSTHSSSGWSTLGGQAANPYALDRSPSGSSSGSAVAVAAGLTPLAIGTETDGSIVSPSSACGIVGIKPTAGLVSRTGIIPISPVQDTAGPMAATVADAAALLSVLAGADPQDPAVEVPADLVRIPRLHQLPRSWRAWRRQDRDLAGRVVRRERRHPGGARRRRGVPAAAGRGRHRPGGPAGHRQHRAARVDRAEIRVQVRHQRVPEVPGGHRGAGDGVPGSLAELIDFNRRNAAMVLSRFGQEIFEQSQATTGDLADPEYLDVRGTATRLAVAALEAPMREHDLDAIAWLTGTPGLADGLRARGP